MERWRRQIQPALHHHPLAIADTAVARRAVDVVSLLTALAATVKVIGTGDLL